MNLEALARAAEKKLQRTERAQAMYALTGKLDILDRHRYVRLGKIPIDQYLAVGEVVELHRSLLPPDEVDYGDWPPGRKFNWALWTRTRVDHTGPHCVSVILRRWGELMIPCGDFVRAVMTGNVRVPLNAATPPPVEGAL